MLDDMPAAATVFEKQLMATCTHSTPSYRLSVKGLVERLQEEYQRLRSATALIAANALQSSLALGGPNTPTFTTPPASKPQTRAMSVRTTSVSLASRACIMPGPFLQNLINQPRMSCHRCTVIGASQTAFAQRSRKGACLAEVAEGS